MGLFFLMARQKIGAATMAVNRAQATIYMAKRIAGMNNREIAKELGVGLAVVERRLTLAAKEHLLEDATDRVVKELLPLAHLAYLKALQEGDLEAARDVMFGSGILSKNNKPQIAPQGEMTLALWREGRQKGYEAAETETIDGTPAGAGALVRPPPPRPEVGEELGEDDPQERPGGWPDPLPDEGAWGSDEGAEAAGGDADEDS
jgi:hypothetical protein